MNDSTQSTTSPFPRRRYENPRDSLKRKYENPRDSLKKNSRMSQVRFYITFAFLLNTIWVAMYEKKDAEKISKCNNEEEKKNKVEDIDNTSE
jgi:hypothetical protein